MKAILLNIIFFLGFNSAIFAQVGIGTSTPAASAQLEVSSSSKGFLPPRVGLTSINDVSTISSPASGLTIYNTATAGTSPNNVTPGYYYYNGTNWQRLMNASSIILKKSILINSVAPTNSYSGQATISDWSGTYVGSGGTVEVRANFTAWTNSAGQTRTFKLLRDGTEVDNSLFYFNQNSVHTTMPELIAIIPNETGSHTYAIQIPSGTIVDTGDNATIVVYETKLQ
jgi:hypothetical protein